MKRHIRVALVIVVMIAAGMFLPRMVSSREDIREVRIVAQNMTYYVDGSTEPNPALRLVPGEQVRLTFRNQDKGMIHDVRLPALGVGTKVVGFDREESIVFRVPANAPAGEYVCTPHSAMMSGKVVIQ